jgi:serine/threonine-protein kinase
MHPPDDPVWGPTLPAADLPPTQPAADPSDGGGPPPARAGRCGLVGEIARGGMGAVFEARDPDLGRRLAVKVLLEQHRDHPDLIRRFLAEARICGQLQHPGIVPVHEVGRLDDGRPFFTMKLVKGRTLAEELAERSGPAADLPRFLAVFEQVCQTMAYAHSRGVIHRDLKPSNVMVGAFGEVQVMDWGLAKVLGGPPEEGSPAGEEPAAADGMSRTGSVLGTPAYMAPEQAEGAVERVDARADVFGLGAVLCEVLTGAPPYRGRGGMDLLQAASADLADAFERLDACGADPELVALAKDCLAADRDARPADAAAVAGRATAYLAGVQERLKAAELAQAEARAQAAEGRKRRRLVLALAGAGLVLLFSAAAAALWYQQDRAAIAAAEQKRQQEADNKRAATEQAAEGAVREADRLRRQGRYAEALAAARLAEGMLEDDAGAAVAGRVRELNADLRVLVALDEAPLRIMLMEHKGPVIDLDRAAEFYATAFRDYGLDVPALDADEAVRRLGGKAVRAELTAALQDWARAAPDAGLKARLTAVVRAVTASWGAPPPARTQHMKAAAAEAAYLVGKAWREKNDDAAAVEAFQHAISLRPDEARFHHALGGALEGQGDWALAVLAYREAVHLRPDDASYRNDLGRALRARGDASAAADAHREAARREPNNGYFHYCLGLALEDGGDWPAACEAYREAVRLKPAEREYLVRLGRALMRTDRAGEAAAYLSRAAELGGSDDPDDPLRAAETWPAKLLRQRQIFPVLPALIRGEAELADAELQWEAAEIAYGRRRYAASAALSARAFAHASELADDLAAGRRYAAACAAALAGAGRDEGQDRPDDAARARWRRQAVDWLRADLARWAGRLDRRGAAAGPEVARVMRHWLADPDLTGLRATLALDRLPAPEREECRRLWADVAALYRRASAP